MNRDKWILYAALVVVMTAWNFSSFKPPIIFFLSIYVTAGFLIGYFGPAGRR